jgi:chromatin segregation and condensation protein Rec8/ScpA/Scc1 (kleisin family)
MARQLEEIPLDTNKAAPAHLSARERFAAMKERQVAQRSDTPVAEEVSVAPVVTEHYRALKEQQVMEHLDILTFPAPSLIPERYRDLKERQVEHTINGEER